jgi:hypothetical protein
MEGRDQYHALAAFHVGNNPSTHRAGGCVGLKTGLDILGERDKSFRPTEIPTADRAAGVAESSFVIKKYVTRSPHSSRDRRKPLLIRSYVVQLAYYRRGYQ